MFFPIIYVSIQLFIIYSIMIAVLPEPSGTEEEKEQQEKGNELAKSIALSGYLVVFLIMSQTFSGGLYA